MQLSNTCYFRMLVLEDMHAAAQSTKLIVPRYRLGYIALFKSELTGNKSFLGAVTRPNTQILVQI